MKKLKIAFIILIGIIPVICNAQVEKEVKYKWYTLTEENIHYENEVENICEYYDLSKFIEGEWIYTLEKPEEKSYRTINEEIKEIEIDRNYYNILKIENFEINENIEIYEIEITNTLNEELEFELLNVTESRQKVLDKDLTTSGILEMIDNIDLKFNQTQNIKNLKIKITYKDTGVYFRGINFSIFLNEEIRSNSFSNSELNIETECTDGICTKEFTLKDNIYEDTIKLKTKVYKYKDKSYKCYSLNKTYIPDYHTFLEGYIKDEDNYIEIVKETTKETTSNELKDNFEIENTEEITYQELNKDELTEKIKEDNNSIAMLTEEENFKKEESIIPYILLLVVLLALSILALITKKVVNSRTK